MEPTLFSDRMMELMQKYSSITAQTKKDIAAGTIEIIGNFFYEFCVPSSWHLKDIKRHDDKFVFYRASDTKQAICPKCSTISHIRSKTYKERQIQDLPISGKTVYHEVKENRYYCDNHECSSITFVEQFEEMAEKDARMSERLKDFIVRSSIEASANASSKTLMKIGIKASRDTILRLIKKRGAAIVTQNSET